MTPNPQEYSGDQPMIFDLVKESNKLLRELTEKVNDQSLMLATLQSDSKGKDALDEEKHLNLDRRVQALEGNQKWFVLSVMALVLNAIKGLIFK